MDKNNLYITTLLAWHLIFLFYVCATNQKLAIRVSLYLVIAYVVCLG
jgi:hypothetical protein